MLRMEWAPMKDELDKGASNAKAAREARLKAALRDNLKRRKSQARGRAGMTVVTPEDDARERRTNLHARNPANRRRNVCALYAECDAVLLSE